MNNQSLSVSAGTSGSMFLQILHWYSGCSSGLAASMASSITSSHSPCTILHNTGTHESHECCLPAIIIVSCNPVLLYLMANYIILHCNFHTSFHKHGNMATMVSCNPVLLFLLVNYLIHHQNFPHFISLTWQ